MNFNSLKGFSTSDLFLASFLRLSGCQLLAIDRQDKKRVRFIFDETAEEMAMEYFNNKAMVSAGAFSRAVAESRNMVFDIG